ncbi:MAG: DUF1829 domain-containing protein [Dehalococcoidia bacterium]
MLEEVSRLLDEYTQWLRDKTYLREVGDWVEITTPYLDRHNDRLQIYASRSNGDFLLTDDAYVIQDLKLSGCELDTKKRRELLDMTLNGFGVQREGDAIQVRASSGNFAQRKHNLTQALLAVNDLFYLAEPSVRSLFMEDVAAWLELVEVRYTPTVKFTGKSGYDHVFDFVIPASRSAPERIVDAMNKPSRDRAQSVAFAWIDIKDVRKPDATAYVLVNDQEVEPPTAVYEALRSYDVVPVPWSKRDDFREALAA